MPYAGGYLLMFLSATWYLHYALAATRHQTRQLAASRPKTSPVQPDYQLYHTKADLLRKVKDVVSQSAIMRMETRTATDGNYTANMLIVTVDAAGIENQEASKAKLLLDFGEHGREFISSELALRLLQVLDNYTLLEHTLGPNVTAQTTNRLKSMLRHTVFKVIPMENGNGRDIVENGDFCYRKNGRGVDPNRNWAIDWGKKEKDYLEYEEYPGTKPFSEPEVQILLNLTRELRPHLWLNVHSGMEALFTPFDHKASVPEGKESDATIAMLHTINNVLFNNQSVVGSGGKSVGYLAHGTATDYMYLGLKVPISLTWEIYGDTKAHYQDCFRMFNPLTAEAMEEVLTNWVRAILHMLLLLPEHPSTSFLAHLLDATEGATTDKMATSGAHASHPASSGAVTPSTAEAILTSAISATANTESTPNPITDPTLTTVTTQQDDASARATAQQPEGTNPTVASVQQDDMTIIATPEQEQASSTLTASPQQESTTGSDSSDSSITATTTTNTGQPTTHADVTPDNKTLPQSGQGSTLSRKEGLWSQGQGTGSGPSVNIVDTSAAQSALMQGAKLAGVWTLTVALVGLVGVVTLVARYGRQPKRRPLVLYRTAVR